MAVRGCPFCGAHCVGATCPDCHRDPTATRRICGACGKATPVAEPSCCHCGAAVRSELRWKVPVIVFMFVVAIVFGVVVQLVGL